MGTHSKPQTVRAANNWVLMMPAISAHRNMVGACSPGACGRKQRTFGAASESVVSMWPSEARVSSCHRVCSEKLGLGEDDFSRH